MVLSIQSVVGCFLYHKLFKGERNMELAICFKNGHVAYFKEVKNFSVVRDTFIDFHYFCMTSQLEKIARWSIS